MKEVYGGVRAVTFLCGDLGPARGFYVDRLGLAVMNEEAGRFAIVNAGTFRLRLEVAGPGRRPTCGVTLTFRVRHLGHTATELDRRSVGYDLGSHRTTGDFLEVADPQGNRVRFSERV